MTEEQTKHLAALLTFACNAIADCKTHDLPEVAGVTEEEADHARTAHDYWISALKAGSLADIDTSNMILYRSEDWVTLLNTLCKTR